MHVTELNQSEVYYTHITANDVISAFVLRVDNTIVLVTRFGDYSYDQSLRICLPKSGQAFPLALPSSGWFKSDLLLDSVETIVKQRFQAQLELTA